MTTHRLKTLPGYYKLVLNGEKPFELRKDDRGFFAGDFLVLQEWDPFSGYTGRELIREVTCVVSGEWLRPGYVALGLGIAPTKVVLRLLDEQRARKQGR